jgi:transcriptional regulator with XRE-family HTH domain
MSKAGKKLALAQEQKAVIEAIRARACKERPGPDEMIDRGELDALVPHAQYLEVRAFDVKMRGIRERLGLSLTDVSERSGLTRAVISPLETGRKQNATLETLFRYAEALEADLRLSMNAPRPVEHEITAPQVQIPNRGSRRTRSEQARPPTQKG